MKHQGKIFEKAVRKSNISITKIAKATGYSPRHFYNLFENEIISNDLFVKVGKIIGFNFEQDVPELRAYLLAKEPEGEYISNKDYMQRYLELMEKHIKLIEELESIKGIKEPVTYKKQPAKRKK